MCIVYMFTISHFMEEVNPCCIGLNSKTIKSPWLKRKSILIFIALNLFDYSEIVYLSFFVLSKFV